MIIAQISDCHVMADPDHPHNLQLARIVADLNAMQPGPDFVIASGDLVNFGADEEYQQLRPLLDGLPMPLFVMPGNHDKRKPFRQHFADHAYLAGNGLAKTGEFMHYTLEDHPLRFIMLDTIEPGQHPGRFCPERQAWLAERLAEERKKPTVIAMHHPPIKTGMLIMDGDITESCGSRN